MKPVKIIQKDRGVLRGIDYEDPIVVYRGERVLGALKKLRGEEDDLPLSLAIDVFYSYYLPLPVLEAPKDIPRDKILQYRLISSMMTDPYVDQVKVHTIADSSTSMVMAVSYLEKVLELMEQHGLNQGAGGGGESKQGVGGVGGEGDEGEREEKNELEKKI